MRQSGKISFFGFLLVFVLAGCFCEYFYQTSPQRVVHFNQFQSKLISKELSTARILKKMSNLLDNHSVNELINFSFPDDDISFYVYRGNELIFWSDHHLDVSSISLNDSVELHFVQLPNAYCVSKTLSADSLKLLALIKIKNNFPYENDQLINDFAKGFNLNKNVGIVGGSNLDKYAVFSSHGDYLFSLSEPTVPVYDERWALAGLISFLLFFLLFFVWYARGFSLSRTKSLQWKDFCGYVLITGALLAVMLYFNFPSVLLANKLFAPYLYAVPPLLNSTVHLTLLTVYIFSTVFLFYRHVQLGNSVSFLRSFGLLLMLPLYFLLFYYVLRGVVYHSGPQILILSFKNFSIFTVWMHILMLLWGIGFALLFFKIHTFLTRHYYIKIAFAIDAIFSCLFAMAAFKVFPEMWKLSFFSYLFLWIPLYGFYIVNFSRKRNVKLIIYVLFFSIFFIGNVVVLSNEKKFNKYRIAAENLSLNGTIENDQMTEILMEELDAQLSRDRFVNQLMRNSDSVEVLSEYLNNSYLRGFWNRFEVHINAVSKNSDLCKEYQLFLQEKGIKIKQTHFYNIIPNEKNISYLGVFSVLTAGNDSTCYFMEFYPRQNFRSYSFPNLLISSPPSILSQLNVSLARYDHRKLVYRNGNFVYPDVSNWIPFENSNYFVVHYADRRHYVYAPDRNTYLVLTENVQYGEGAYLLYFCYAFLAFFALCWLLQQVDDFFAKGRKFTLSFINRFQISFIALLILSFIGIFYSSVDYIRNNYEKEQIQNLENKKIYIQKALQNLYYWNKDLSDKNTQTLNLDLQDLSYTFHTDVHVYNNDGILVGSSQPLIFSKKLISNRIAPKPYFTEDANINQYENIGHLNYLTAYTDFFNGDYLQIGYIAVPQFFSQDEIQNEIESFISVIVHIYFVIILLVIILTLLIGNQISAPLMMLEKKLKEIRLGRRNEKIDYRYDDEIGQLVAQYNRTVDELEESARLLARSERESAWKSMARQVAHEINNPLTPMKLTIQQLSRTKKMDKEKFNEYFDKASQMLVEQIDNLSQIARAFSDFARMPEAKFERVELGELLKSEVEFFKHNYEKVDISFEGSKEPIYTFADPKQLIQVFNNLIKNAIQSIPENRQGKIEVKISTSHQQIEIRISDNGAGIPEDIRDKLFIPNFTTKSTGMGLGLAISKNIIEVTGGNISFTTQIDKGTTFIVTLPKA